jgi:hypothetical protein
MKQSSSFITALISYTAGDQMPNIVRVATVSTTHDQITFYLQTIAFCVTILAGLVSLYFSLKKFKNEKVH